MSVDVKEQPNLVLRAMSLAFYQAWHELTLRAMREHATQEDGNTAPQQEIPQLLDLPKVEIRLSGFSPVTPLRLLKANCIGARVQTLVVLFVVRKQGRA